MSESPAPAKPVSTARRRVLRAAAAVVGALALALGASIATTVRADAPADGAPAPKFRLQDQTGRWVTLDEQKGRWVVLYFYPKDDTPGCTTEACQFRDNIFAFREDGAVVIGVSVDDVESHGKFASENKLPFPILADSTKATAKAYGVLYKALGLFELARRETFLIDPQGRIAKHYTDVDPKEHSAVVLRDLKSLRARSG